MAHLNVKLLEKIAAKLGKKKRTQVNVIVSKLASKLGISSEAALVLIATENNIGTAWYLRDLDPEKQREVRENLTSLFPKQRRQIERPGEAKETRKQKSTRTNSRTSLKAALDYLLQDDELRGRCTDLLLGRSNFDRAINQATLVLEDRIRTKGQPIDRLVGETLVNAIFKEDISQTVLKISTNPDEQRGITSILRGMMSSFRNLTHHHITHQFTREDAIRVCGFIDVLLRVIDNAVKVR
ncbi:MAG: TIGR02391 family protein [Sedimentisphaerales bacterium]|jgi:uncharacterized protein (TIGR02391 family)